MCILDYFPLPPCDWKSCGTMNFVQSIHFFPLFITVSVPVGETVIFMMFCFEVLKHSHKSLQRWCRWWWQLGGRHQSQWISNLCVCWLAWQPGVHPYNTHHDIHQQPHNWIPEQASRGPANYVFCQPFHAADPPHKWNRTQFQGHGLDAGWGEWTFLLATSLPHSSKFTSRCSAWIFIWLQFNLVLENL